MDIYFKNKNKKDGANPLHYTIGSHLVHKPSNFVAKNGFTLLEKGVNMKNISQRNKHKQIKSKKSKVLLRVKCPHVSITFEGTRKEFLPFLKVRQIPSESK